MSIFITGANKGLGLEFVRYFSGEGTLVYASCRNPEKAEELRSLADKAKNIQMYKLDVTKQEQIEQVARELCSQKIDILVNNAGNYGHRGVTIGNIDRNNFIDLMNINCLGSLKTSEAFLPHLKAGDRKLIVSISSQMGSISDNSSGGAYAYRASKAALNAIMRSFAIDVSVFGIKVLTLHPGWVKTSMGGQRALITVEESVRGMVEQIKEYGNSDHGQILRRYDNKTVAW